MARFLRLLMTLVVLMNGPLSVLGCGVVGESTAQVRLATADVGGSTTSSGTNTWRATSQGRAGLLSILSRMLAGSSTVEGGDDHEFEVGDAPDLVDDDGPQGFVAAAFSGPSIQGLPAHCDESNLLAIQPSIGHPRGDDEPPRV